MIKSLHLIMFVRKSFLIVNMSLDDIEVGYNKTVLELKQLVELLKKR